MVSQQNSICSDLFPSKSLLILLASSALMLVGCSNDELSTWVASNDLTNSSSNANDVESKQKSVRKEPIRPLRMPPNLSREKIALGRSLFNDVRLSADNSISCATCHDVKNGGDDGQPTSTGFGGHKGGLNAPTVLNSSLSIAQFWNGRAKNLAEQAPGPIHNPIEMNSNWSDIIGKLQSDGAFASRFKNTYQQGFNEETIVDAIVSYEQALITVNSPFDKYLLGDDDAISKEALAGYRLFKSIGCISCHQGQTVGGNMFQEFGIMGDYFAQFNQTSEADNGRISVTNRSVDLHRFKVPSLRNIELTAPYFHNGSAASLAEAINIMAEFQLGESIAEENVDLLIAFLRSLTGDVSDDLQ